MPNRGKIALWAFVIMMLSFTVAFSSFVRTGILQVSTSNGLSYHISMADSDAIPLKTPLIADSHSASYQIKQLLIKTEFDEVVIYPSQDEAYHFSVSTSTESDLPKLDIIERGDLLTVSVSRSNPLGFNSPVSTLEVRVPNQNFQILKIETSSGNILIKEPLAYTFDTCELESQSGNITLPFLSVKHLKADSDSGNIVISSEPKGDIDLTATTDSGLIRMNWPNSHQLSEEGTKLDIDTADQSIVFDLISSSGDITLNQ